MAGNPYLSNLNGRPAEVRGLQSSAGAADAGKIPALDSTGRLDPTLMPVGVVAEVQLATASETISAGAWVNLYLDSAILKVRNADGTTNGKPCNGFVLAGGILGDVLSVYLEGINTQVSGRTIGALQFLAVTPGAAVEAAPAAAGNLVQQLGTALSATAVSFAPREICTKA